MWSDRVTFRVQMCPHVMVNVTADETWGTHHRYALRAACETCGPVFREERRPAYAG